MQVRYSVNKVVRPPITTNHPKVTKENLLKVNLLAKEYLSLSVATHENGTVLFLLKSFFLWQLCIIGSSRVVRGFYLRKRLYLKVKFCIV